MALNFVRGNKRAAGNNTFGEGAPQQVTQQGIITGNLDVAVDYIKGRSKQPSANHLGTYTDPKELTIFPYEFAFINVEANDVGFKNGTSGRCFTSFNGLDISDIENDAQLARKYPCIGLTTSSVHINKDVITRSGVSVMYSGSVTTYNIGDKVIHAGQQVKVVYPSIDPLTLKKQLARRKNPGGGNGPYPTKLVPITEPFIPSKDCLELYKVLVADLIESTLDTKKAKFNYTITDLITSIKTRTNKLSDQQQMSVRINQLISTISYNSVMQLIKIGYLTIPNYTGSLSSSQTDFENFFDQINKIRADEWWENRWDNATRRFIKLNENQQNQYRSDVDDYARFLSTSLGISEDGTIDWLMRDSGAVAAIQIRSAGSASGINKYAQFQSEMIKSDFIQTRGTNIGLFGGRGGIGNIATQTLEASQSAMTGYVRASSRTYQIELSKVVGTSSSHSPPGRALDLVT